MYIFNSRLRNTRFVLTLVAMGMLGFAILSDVSLILFASITGKEVDSSLLAIFTTVIGLLGGLVTTAYNSYFKDMATAETPEKKPEQGPKGGPKDEPTEKPKDEHNKVSTNG